MMAPTILVEEDEIIIFYTGKKRDQFRLLKENFRNLGQYDDEDRAYYWLKYYEIRVEFVGSYNKFKECFLSKEWNIKKSGRIFLGSISLIGSLFVFIYKWLAYEKVGRYGTSPLRVAFSMLFIIFGFSCMYSKFAPLSENLVTKTKPAYFFL